MLVGFDIPSEPAALRAESIEIQLTFVIGQTIATRTPNILLTGDVIPTHRALFSFFNRLVFVVSHFASLAIARKKMLRRDLSARRPRLRGPAILVAGVGEDVSLSAVAYAMAHRLFIF
jgi:hypothetical protein